MSETDKTREGKEQKKKKKSAGGDSVSERVTRTRKKMRASERETGEREEFSQCLLALIECDSVTAL